MSVTPPLPCGGPRRTASGPVPGAALAALAASLLVAACSPTEWPAPPLHGDATRGRELVRYYGCGGCHYIPDLPDARGHTGPPLADVRKRGYLGGVLPNDAENMVAWLRAPEAADPGTAMPNLGLSEAEARDIAAFLYALGGDA